MKNLLIGIVFILLIGFGGFFYRNAVEYNDRPIKCPVDTFVCPDGTELSHIGISCEFPACPPPNVTLEEVGITFALPEGFTSRSTSETNSIAAYEKPGPSEQEPQTIILRRYPLNASTTALETIQESAIGGASGEPVSPSQFSSLTLGGRTITVVPIERFEAVVQVAYYITRPNDVLRFDATDRGVVDWTEPDLQIATLPAQQALRQMLSTLQSR